MGGAELTLLDKLLFGNAQTVDVSSGDHDFLQSISSIYVGVAGNVKVDMGGNGTAVTFYTVSAGTMLPIHVIKVYQTGTTAGAMVGLS